MYILKNKETNLYKNMGSESCVLVSVATRYEHAEINNNTHIPVKFEIKVNPKGKFYIYKRDDRYIYFDEEAYYTVSTTPNMQQAALFKDTQAVVGGEPNVEYIKVDVLLDNVIINNLKV